MLLAHVRRVVEFGVLHGASIRWLAECFPRAEIIGADILPEQPEWPRDPRISYRQVDQADRQTVSHQCSNSIEGDVELIIDDGSHMPRHQASCLAEGMARVRPGGLYIVEDICTSHPLQSAFAHASIIGGERVAERAQCPDGDPASPGYRRGLRPGSSAAARRAGVFQSAMTMSTHCSRQPIARIPIFTNGPSFRCGATPVAAVISTTSHVACANAVPRCITPANSMTALVWKRQAGANTLSASPSIARGAGSMIPWNAASRCRTGMT